MAPTLYYNEISPPVRSVRLTAKALGLDLDLKALNLPAKEQLNPEYLKLNPQHTIPTLVEEDGFVIWDSHAINAYLVGKYGKDDSLYPKDLRQRAIVDQRLHFDSSILFTRLAFPVKKIFYAGAKEVSQEFVNLIGEAYDFLEKFLDNDYIAGNQLTIADFSTVATTTSLSILVPINESKYPRITSWIKRLKNLPYYEEANGKGRDLMESVIKEKLNS